MNQIDPGIPRLAPVQIYPRAIEGFRSGEELRTTRPADRSPGTDALEEGGRDASLPSFDSGGSAR